LLNAGPGPQRIERVRAAGAIQMTVRSAKPTIGGFASPIVVFFAGNRGRPANL